MRSLLTRTGIRTVAAVLHERSPSCLNCDPAVDLFDLLSSLWIYFLDMTWRDPSVPLAALVTLDDLSVAVPDEDAPTPALRLASIVEDRGFEKLCMPLTTEKWRTRWRGMCVMPDNKELERGSQEKQEILRLAEDWRAHPRFLKDEVTITRLDEADGLTILASEWLELDAADDWVRHDAEIALRQEIAYASYLNIQTMILPPPRNRAHIASYARAINSALLNPGYMTFCIRLPIYDPSIFRSVSADRSSVSWGHGLAIDPPSLAIPKTTSKVYRSPRAPEGELNATWEMWDIIRSICDYNPRLALALDLAPPLPSAHGILSKWAAEPVRFLFLPASTFIANAKGYPVLPKATQSFIRDSMSHRPTVILSETDAGTHSRGGEEAYVQYIRHLEKTSPAVQAMMREGTVENFAVGYQDYLQAPLQPLMDNLPSGTYETFEQDPVKYRQYEEAICQALYDWPDQERIIICVAGAGRGPLVARALKAIQRSKRKAFVYAIEKNPSAIVTLEHRHEAEWGDDRVKLFFGDMRSLSLPEQVDILVSELLGSFGDNELSPECLDGAMRFLKPDGVSIPSSYTAHIAPLSSSKLYNEASSSKDVRRAETPYVVMFQAVNILSGSGGGLGGRCGPQVQECWEFEHPRRDAVLDAQGLPPTNSHNIRSASLQFYIPHAGILHGLAGYFEAVLYGDVGLSIHPHRKDDISKDMLSWFPIFFPFKEPLYLPSNSELRVSMWRLTDKHKVWYEWYAESFLPVYSVSQPGSPTKSAEDAPFHHRFSFTSGSTVAAPSPLIDAIDMMADVREAAAAAESNKSPGHVPAENVGVVKIGQTSLHNPGGRSSWIGL